MARILLLTAFPESNPRPRGGYLSLKRNALIDRFKVHQIVEDPAEADIILFAEVDAGRFCEQVRNHPYVANFREKCFIMCTDYRTLPFLPGIYTGLEKKWHHPERTHPGFYFDCLINPLVSFDSTTECDFLYSFVGDIKTHPVRPVLAKLKHPRGLFVDTSGESQAVMWLGTDEEKTVFWDRYAKIARSSKFILCPRGVAPSSIRLFETMCLGRVPVVLADQWVRPDGPAWDSFILQVPERDAPSVLSIMEEKEAQAIEMGLRARAAWEKYFAPDIVFHRAVEACLEMQKARQFPESLGRFSIIPQLLQPFVIREYLRQYKKQLVG
jgi:hypothetical protein